MTNKVEVLLVPKEISGKKLADKLVVMIDVLRASSTIVTALARGCSGFIPIYSPEKAVEKMKCLKQEETLLCGERNGMKIKGFLGGFLNAKGGFMDFGFLGDFIL